MRASILIASILLLSSLSAPAPASARPAKGLRAESSGPGNHILAAPPNDRCDNAILLTCGNIHLSGSMAQATNDYALADSNLSCTQSTTYGRDVVYKLNVGVGDSLWINYTSVVDGAAYIVTDCGNVNGTCVAGVDAVFNPGSTEHLRFKFTIGGTYYLILDSYGLNSGGDWTAVGQLICGPSTPPQNDLCEAAIRIPCGPFSLGGTTQFAHNNSSLPNDASSCTGHWAEGADVYYRVVVDAGDSISIDYNSPESDASVYIVNDCKDPLGSCVVGVDQAGVGQAEHLRYKFVFGGIYLIVFDLAGPGSTGTWTASGALTCINPPPVNDACVDAIDIPCGDFNLSGNTALANDDYNFPDASTGCTGYAADGNDVVYRLNVAAGDSISVDYVSTADASIYITQNCAFPDSFCVTGVDDGLTGDPEHLRYKFHVPMTCYLILDSADPFSSGTWTATGHLQCGLTGVDRPLIPVEIALKQAVPNPFHGVTTLLYSMPRGGTATLKVFDLQGRSVRTLVDGPVPPGDHRVTWDGNGDQGSKLAAGVYFARLTAAGGTSIRRMIFVR